ncbi:MAG TPA: hypothetical protein ENI49_07000 [Thermoplasmatales archaeon]|uniref:Uncharacterized protein n=1 Tax=Candidatus Syntropharchaeum caldarium TaxID=1838285 RepID=A0A1F2P7N5_9EURY|nr:MAG: hypothetical protein SCAL_001680 [Candidatus Syntrophoarchaeum caldarius]HEC87590.1 hypothetical protein [Thermoplasmatales archaeon]
MESNYINQTPKKWGELSANTKTKDEIKLEVYSDEINRVKLSIDNSVWMYIGALFVPINFKDYCLTKLNNLRCVKYGNWHDEESECPQQCGFHEDNDTEIHYKNLHKSKSDAGPKIAKNWINKFMIQESCQKHRKPVYLNILGLNLSNMNLELFGENKGRDLTIYNRFYRSVLKGGINYFFRDYRRITIRQIYHDKGSQETHELFSWHPIYRIGLESEKIKIERDEIEFIDSDHRKSGKKESHFIQLIDLILGATYVCLHNPSDRREKKEVGLAFKPALTVLLDRKKNPNNNYMEGSYYHSNYYRTYQISFFPKKKMELDEIFNQLDVYGNQMTENMRIEDNFYYDRPILLTDPSQRDLTGWF